MMMQKNKPNGFTLIEFLVASALAVIVVLAVSSTYMITRKLNTSAQKRIDVQDNIRNAATMITRDARVAGSFGCFVTGGTFAAGTTIDTTSTISAAKNFPEVGNGWLGDKFKLDVNAADGFGVMVQDANSLGITAGSGVALKGNALVFIYGKGDAGLTALSGNTLTLANTDDSSVKDALAEKSNMVLSSCQNASSFKVSDSSDKEVTLANSGQITNVSSDALGTLSVSQLYAAVYTIGTVNGKDSLLRYDVDTKGKWQGPQLLATDVSSMKTSFAYEQACKTDKLNKASDPVTPTNFVMSDTLKYKNLPALIQIELEYAGSVRSTYIINASVRGGNQCVNTTNYDPISS